MSILEFHLHKLHDFQLSGQLLNFLLEFFVLLVQICGLLVRLAHAVEGERGANASGPQLIVPQIALSLDDTIEFGTKNQHYRCGGAHLGANEAEKVFNIWSRIGQYEHTTHNENGRHQGKSKSINKQQRQQGQMRWLATY